MADGTNVADLSYRNPILDADWPDLDVIRVHERYYLVASSMNRAPGLPILTSNDLVNWSILGNALPALEPADYFALPRHGAGVWAPAIRHHDGRFWIFYPDPDQGIFRVTATDAAGPWSAPVLVLPGPGVIDPCPLWDDDGRVWLVFAWARSRSGISNRLTIVELGADATRAIGPPQTIIEGADLPGYSTLEGPKLYKRDGWYWIFAPAGGVATGWQSVFRSRSVLGPYEERIVLRQGESAVNGPHQGAWVTTVHGEDWFLHFQDRGVFGRVVHLQPMRWSEDGWPEIGVGGEPVDAYRLPHGAAAQGTMRPARDDDFGATELGRQWHWQANPDASWVWLDGDGFARLRAVDNDLGSLRAIGQVLGQQLPGLATEFTTSLRLDWPRPGCRAGVVVLGLSYAWVGLAADGTGAVAVTAGASPLDGPDSVVFRSDVDASGLTVELRVRSDLEGRCELAFRLRFDDAWTIAVPRFQATAGHWVSAEVGLFAAAPPSRSPHAEGSAHAEGVFGPVSVRSDAS